MRWLWDCFCNGFAWERQWATRNTAPTAVAPAVEPVTKEEFIAIALALLWEQENQAEVRKALAAEEAKLDGVVLAWADRVGALAKISPREVFDRVMTYEGSAQSAFDGIRNAWREQHA